MAYLLHIPKISTTIYLYLLSFLLFSKTHLSLSITNPTLNPSLPHQSITDIHELLPQYGLPRGLIPDNVESFTLSPSGSFSVQLTTPCYVQFDQLVYYEKDIKGELSYGDVHDVSGIQAKKLFVWVPVTGIKVSEDGDGMLQFFVGPFSEKLPAKQFEDIPSCEKASGLRTSLESM